MFRYIYLIGLLLLFSQTAFAETVQHKHHKHIVKHTHKVVIKHKNSHHHVKAVHSSHRKTVTHQHKTVIKKMPEEAEKNIHDNSVVVDTTKQVSMQSIQPVPTVSTQSVVTQTQDATPANVHTPNIFQKTVAVLQRTTQESLVSTFGKRVAEYVKQTVKTLHYSDYKFGGTRFDTRKGVYVLDCSSYVDHILQQVSPNAYESLVNSTGTEKPTTHHYYDFFHDLNYDQNDYWNKVDDVEHLRAGDILVFRYKNSRGNETGGHVMVVMDKPMRDTDVFFVRVADSAPSRHSEDTRQANEAGIGIGTLLLKVNPQNGHPSAFSWGIGGYWKKNVNFAMARPIDLDTRV